jgi:hypothetical protein
MYLGSQESKAFLPDVPATEKRSCYLSPHVLTFFGQDTIRLNNHIPPLTACYYFVNLANIYLCEWWSIGAHQISRGVPGGVAQHPTPKADAAYPVRTDAKTWDPDLELLKYF